MKATWKGHKEQQKCTADMHIKHENGRKYVGEGRHHIL